MRIPGTAANPGDLPGPSVYWGSPRRDSQLCKGIMPWQAVPDLAYWGKHLCGDWISYPGGQVPFAGRTGRWAARLPAGAGQDGGRGNYGNAPQRVSGGGPAVPPRVYLYGVWETDDR